MHRIVCLLRIDAAVRHPDTHSTFQHHHHHPTTIPSALTRHPSAYVCTFDGIRHTHTFSCSAFLCSTLLHLRHDKWYVQRFSHAHTKCAVVSTVWHWMLNGWRDFKARMKHNWAIAKSRNCDNSIMLELFVLCVDHLYGFTSGYIGFDVHTQHTKVPWRIIYVHASVHNNDITHPSIRRADPEAVWHCFGT